MGTSAYFQLVLHEKGTFLQMFPGAGGEWPQLPEILQYLAYKKVTYDVAMLGKGYKSYEAGRLIPLSAEKMLPVAECAIIEISPDRMEAVARFYPPSTGGRLLDKEGVYSECRLAKVVFGVDEAVVGDFLANREYCRDYVVAKGKPAKEGTDAFITYHFNTDNRIRPTLNEDGTVDFFNLNLVNPCKVGQVLATLTPEVRGEEGRDVTGVVLKPREVKRAALSYGLNIQLSEDKLSISSRVDGHVTLTGGKVFVSDVMQVQNVDNSTGNIDYSGNVVVEGNVNSNFSVKTDGDIEVRGVVEGAQLEAGGNIILVRGINGMGKGVLKAGGNIISKFIENCKVDAGGYVETNSILHSDVHAGTDINVMNQKGFITGGEVVALSTIRVRTLGSHMGADTRVTVGVDPKTITRMGVLTKEVTDAQKTVKQLVPVLEAAKKKMAAGVKMGPDQIKQLQNVATTIKASQEAFTAANAELEELKQQMAEGENASVEVSGEVYPGVVIAISDVSMIIKNVVKYSRFIKSKGDVRITAL